MKIVWHPAAWNEYLAWQTDDRRLLRRINEFVRDIQRGNEDGIGKPELLKGDLSGRSSRRINQEHRLVYRITSSGDLEILMCRHHYG